MKIKKKVRGVGLGGQGGCEQRIEVFVKIQKKLGGGGVLVDVYEEVKLYRGGGGIREGVEGRGLVGSKIGGSG